jgi:hypothetical protein
MAQPHPLAALMARQGRWHIHLHSTAAQRQWRYLRLVCARVVASGVQPHPQAALRDLQGRQHIHLQYSKAWKVSAMRYQFTRWPCQLYVCQYLQQPHLRMLVLQLLHWGPPACIQPNTLTRRQPHTYESQLSMLISATAPPANAGAPRPAFGSSCLYSAQYFDPKAAPWPHAYKSQPV